MSGPHESGTAIALPAAMKRYRLIEVGCSRELYAIAEDTTDVRPRDTVARFTVQGETPAWIQRPMTAFVVRKPRRLRVHARMLTT